MQKNKFGDGQGGAKLQIVSAAAEDGQDAAKCGWKSTCTVPTPNGCSVMQTATGTSKKAAEASAVEMVLKVLRNLGLMRNVRDVASTPAAGGVEPSAKRTKLSSFDFEDGAGAAPPLQAIRAEALEMSQRKVEAEGIRGNDGKGGGKRKVVFGYNIESAKGCLLQYIRKRGLSDKIPSVPLQPTGCQATKLREAPTYLALEAGRATLARQVVAELVQHGELSPFQSKTDALREGLQPLDAGLTPEAEARLTAALGKLGVPLGGSGQMVQPWVDASAWATTPTAR
ncbi:unnamed protein product, partial [Prorocentrum cordatum]